MKNKINKGEKLFFENNIKIKMPLPHEEIVECTCVQQEKRKLFIQILRECCRTNNHRKSITIVSNSFIDCLIINDICVFILRWTISNFFRK